MSDAIEPANLHPLVNQARKLFAKSAKRVKDVTTTALSDEELAALAKKVKACPDDHHALGVDFVAQAIALHRHKWTKAAEQMVKLASLVLSDETMQDELSKSTAPTPGVGRANPKSTIAGLQPPGARGAIKEAHW